DRAPLQRGLPSPSPPTVFRKPLATPPCGQPGDGGGRSPGGLRRGAFHYVVHLETIRPGLFQGVTPVDGSAPPTGGDALPCNRLSNSAGSHPGIGECAKSATLRVTMASSAALKAAAIRMLSSKSL